MYLSYFRLNRNNLQARRDYDSAYSMHQTICRAFGESRERILWRSDAGGGVLLQSLSQPDWEAVRSHFSDYFYKEPQTKVFDLSGIHAEQTLRFTLRANVTANKWLDNQDRDKNPRTKRVALHDAEKQLQWLGRQGTSKGFSFTDTDIIQSGKVRLYKPKGNVITLFAVTFEGTLKVDNPQLFSESVKAGIGKAKALGFGLLSIAP